MAENITREILIQALEAEINHIYNHRRAIVVDGYLKRTAWDRLAEKSLLDSNALMDELDKIANKESKLPSEERKLAKEILRRAMLRIPNLKEDK